MGRSWVEAADNRSSDSITAYCRYVVSLSGFGGIGIESPSAPPPSLALGRDIPTEHFIKRCRAGLSTNKYADNTTQQKRLSPQLQRVPCRSEPLL